MTEPTTTEASLHDQVVADLLDMGFSQESIDSAIRSLSPAQSSSASISDVLELLIGSHPQPELIRRPSGSPRSSNVIPPHPLQEDSCGHGVNGTNCISGGYAAPTRCSESTLTRTTEGYTASPRCLDSVSPQTSAPGMVAQPGPPPSLDRLRSDEMDISKILELARSLSVESRNTAEMAQVQGVALQSVVRMLLRAVEYEQRCIITPDERKTMKRFLDEGRAQDARVLLDSANARHLERPRETCPICFDEIKDGEEFRLGCGHLYCCDCVRGLCSAVAFPTCPNTACAYMLVEEEVGKAAGAERQQAFQDMQLRQAVDRLAGRVECPNPECNSVVLCEGERARVDCQCGWPSFCSKCRQPYHAHKDCNDVAQLREKWVQWVMEGRHAYHGQIEAAEAASKQQDAAQEALRRQNELAADEEYKAKHCRCCPQCGRCVQKLEGCDSMKCGENYHGGDKQDGCGASFNWASAPKYTARVERRPVPKVDFENLNVDGKDARHLLIRCDGCQATNIRGPRFHCVHCPAFNLCIDCDLKVTHPAEHVFEIILSSSTVPAHLPVGTEVEFFGLKQNMTLNRRKAIVQRFLPNGSPAKFAYDLKLSEPFEVPLAVGSSRGERRDGMLQRIQRAAQHWFGDETQEMSLTAGSTVNQLDAVPACFLQLAAISDVEVLETLEAADVQSSAAQKMPWKALPEGQPVLVTGLLTPAVRLGCNTMQNRSESAHASQLEPFDLQAGAANIAGPYMVGTDCFTVRVPSKQGLWIIPSAAVHPTITSRDEFKRLEEFQAAQQEARSINRGLLKGQRVEVLQQEYLGRIGEIADRDHSRTGNYLVTFPNDSDVSETERKWALLSENWTLQDLMGLSTGQLLDIWDTFDIPRQGLNTPDAYIEQALANLPEKQQPCTFPADCLQPLIRDIVDLLTLQSNAAVMTQTPTPTRSAPSNSLIPTQAMGDEEEACECAKCGEKIRGAVIRQDGLSYHFGCSHMAA